VEIASMYLEGDALELFTWINAEHNHLYWEELVKILHENYGPTEFQNPDEHLCNIKLKVDVRIHKPRNVFKAVSLELDFKAKSRSTSNLRTSDSFNYNKQSSYSTFSRGPGKLLATS
ncbi:hypothetical protein Tco_0166815, partial [Tanacetum coccineum]